MSTIYQFRWLLLATCFLLLSSQRATATHSLGGQLTYKHLTGNQYLVQCKMYADLASAVHLINTRVLSCRVDGCASSDTRNFVVDMQEVGSRQVNGPFLVGGSSYETVTYEATVMLPPASWILSTKEENRSTVNNLLLDAYPRSFYLEATLNTQLAADNSSPQFHDLPVPQLPWQRHVQYSVGGSSTDGDSVIYHLVTPLYDPTALPQFGCPQPVSYATYEAGQLADPATNQTFTYPAGQYSAEFPLISQLPTYPTNGTSPNVVPSFQFNKATGTISAFLAPVRSGSSRYSVAVQADEYRKLNGAYTKIGSVMRELVFIINDPGANQLPELPGLHTNTNPTAQPVEKTVKVVPGQSLRLRIIGTDPDAGQTLHFYTDLTGVPGATFTSTATDATLQWQPTTDTRLGFYYVPVTVVDSNAPLSGFTTHIITIRVVNTILATTDRQELHPAAYPVPFADQLTIRLPTPGQQRLVVLDATGRTVATLTSQADGTVVWRPTAAVAPGTYFLRTANGNQVIKVVRAAY